MANDKAVLVGINRYQYFNGLEGCLQDVTNMAAVLTGRFGFPAENVRTMTDEDATKDAISDGMTWLLDGASSGDRLVFHFSGHGSFDSPDGNPPDGIDGDGLIYDGIICLHDFNFGQPGSYFTSEELRDWTKRLPTGGELVVVLDSCHSGGGTREIRPLDGGRPFLIDAEVTQRLVRAHLASLAISGRASAEREPTDKLAAVANADSANIPHGTLANLDHSFMKKVRFIPPQNYRLSRSILRKKDSTSSMNHVLLAACDINETAGDAAAGQLDGNPHGVFTYYLCQVLLKQDSLRIKRSDLIAEILKPIKDGNWEQTPRLEAVTSDVPLFDVSTAGAPGGNVAVPPVVPSTPQPVGSDTTAPATDGNDIDRRRKLIELLQGRRLEDAYLRPDLRAAIQEEARSAARGNTDALIDPAAVTTLENLVEARRVRDLPLTRPGGTRDVRRTRLLSSATAVIVPGFLASQLSDKASGGRGLIWVNPLLDPFSDRLSFLRLNAPLGADGVENDADPSVKIMPDGPLPVVYDLLRASLETSLFGPRYWTNVFAFDWRRTLDNAAQGLVLFLQSLKSQAPNWPIYVIAHSQGALVARKAIQLMGGGSNQQVDRLILLGPANHGSMSAVRGLGNEVSEVDFVRKFAVEPPQGFNSVLGTMSGLYQLIPSRKDLLPWLENNDTSAPSWWGRGGFPIDSVRLTNYFGWTEKIDTRFFDDRTTVILGGDDPNTTGPASTVGGVIIDGPGAMRVDSAFGILGDGTVPHSCAILEGVPTYIALGTEHSLLATYSEVIDAVHAVLAGNTPALAPVSSDDPTAYAKPRPLSTRALARRPASPPVPYREGAPAHGEADNSFGWLVGTMADVASRSGTMVRVAIEVEPAARP